MDLVDCAKFLIKNGYAITTDCNVCYGTGKRQCYCGGSSNMIQRSEYDGHICCDEEICYSCEDRVKAVNLALKIISLENKIYKQ